MVNISIARNRPYLARPTNSKTGIIRYAETAIKYVPPAQGPIPQTAGLALTGTKLDWSMGRGSAKRTRPFAGQEHSTTRIRRSASSAIKTALNARDLKTTLASPVKLGLF